MVAGDGNGWVSCRCGQRHWGLHGAAGLLLARVDDSVEVLLQLRAQWTHQGGTWGIPGGAVDSHEDGTAGALREAHEETDVAPDAVVVLDRVVSADHVDWSYQVVLAVPRRTLQPRVTTAESDDVRWVEVSQVESLPLHPGFADSWPMLRERLTRMTQ